MLSLDARATVANFAVPIRADTAKNPVERSFIP